MLVPLLSGPLPVSMVGADTGPSDPRGSSDQTPDIALQIQNICFSEYPPKLIRSMSKDADLPAGRLLSDPALRQKYLKTEEIVAKGLFYPTLLDEILPAFEAFVRPGVRLLDLGSGDGRVVFLGAHLGADATGIEYDSRLHRIARSCRKKVAGLLDIDRAHLVRGDFFEHDFGGYEVLFYFAKGSYGEGRLLEKLHREMADDATLLISFPAGPPSGFVMIGDYGNVYAFRVTGREGTGAPEPGR